MPSNPFLVLNLETARFECTFGRGCDGICCRNGRPPIYPDEQQRIDAALHRILPLVRPAARSLIEREGYLSARRKCGQPQLRVIDGWCVFFNAGCTLHQLGEADGDRFRYKPCVCALLPLDRRKDGAWYVRQKDYAGEIWDLFCLAPGQKTPLAGEALREELTLAARIANETA
jgi:hypothetical protein